MITDTHCHLSVFERENRLESILENAANAGVSRMVTIGTDHQDWDLYRRLAARHPGRVWHTAGLHPCDVDEDWEEQLALLPSCFGETPSPVALGEIGLDYFHLPKHPDEAAEIRSRQVKAFRRQLEFAFQFDCPVVIHSRNAFADCVTMIDKSGVDWRKVVFHCFSEGEAEMAELVKRGGFGSFTGPITYKKAENLRAAARLQGLDRLMLETDCPYLTPEPVRGKPNEPAFLRHTADYAAQLFGVSTEELARITSANAARFYGLK